MVHVCAPLTTDIANRNGGYVIEATCDEQQATIKYDDADLAKEFAYRWGGLANPQVRMDNDFIDSCRSVVLGVDTAVHTLEQAWVDNAGGRGYSRSMLVTRRYIRVRQRTSQSLSCEAVTGPPENNGIYRLTMSCQSQRVVVSCSNPDAAVLFATHWGGYSRKEIAVRTQPGVCTACRVGGDAGWQVAMQTVTLTQSVRYLYVQRQSELRVLTCGALKQNPEIRLDEYVIPMDCRDDKAQAEAKVEMVCGSATTAIEVSRGPFCGKADATVVVQEKVCRSCERVTVKGSLTPMKLGRASIVGAGIELEALAPGQGMNQYSCSHVMSPPQYTPMGTLVMQCACQEQVLEIECREQESALQIATWGKAVVSELAVSKDILKSCAAVRIDNIKNEFTLTKASYQPTSVAQTHPDVVASVVEREEHKRWLTVGFPNNPAGSYDYAVSEFQYTCDPVEAAPEPHRAINTASNAYMVRARCQKDDGSGQKTNVDIICDDQYHARQLAAWWGKLENPKAPVTYSSIYQHVKGVYVDQKPVKFAGELRFISATATQKNLKVVKVANNYYSCGTLTNGRFVYKQFYYFISLMCYDVTKKPKAGQKYPRSDLVLVMDSELSATTVASAFAGLEKGKLLVESKYYFDRAGAAALIADSPSELKGAYIQIYPKELVLDFGAFEYSCREVTEAPRFTVDKQYEVTVYCGKRVDNKEPELKNERIRINFSTMMKATGFAYGFGGYLNHQVDFDPNLLDTVDFVAVPKDIYMGKEELLPLKRATVVFNLKGEVTSRRIEFLRPDHFAGDAPAQRDYHLVTYVCGEMEMAESNSIVTKNGAHDDANTKGKAATLKAVCGESSNGIDPPFQNTPIALLFHHYPEYAETFAKWWNGDFVHVEAPEKPPLNTAGWAGTYQQMQTITKTTKTHVAKFSGSDEAELRQRAREWKANKKQEIAQRAMARGDPFADSRRRASELQADFAPNQGSLDGSMNTMTTQQEGFSPVDGDTTVQSYSRAAGQPLRIR
ncbi:hypothetical protein FOZ62_008047 [Perkinsus olseni]|uniref:Uncharacterized protein n=1 Tax=Perkinsus olseni TaxID=32597 RepID=A0A7J6S2Y6_PEROL|nr:hypothetical protein FOZ62_008047 [Perkinsus olseni]